MRALRALRGSLRGPRRGLLFVLLLLAAGGVAVAGAIAPGVDPPNADAERAAANGTGDGDDVVSLGELEPRSGAGEG
ncbi:MAG: hypothetical protein M3088_04945, partial [Actinomycetota bacterium]|nr:hypothetical protein [Actinomycetota bacterium]